jgi:hypothetical protein
MAPNGRWNKWLGAAGALSLTALLLFASCTPEGGGGGGTVVGGDSTPPKPAAPTFSADSAYAYVEAQVAFGPRVPNTAAHAKCADWLTAQFRRFGCTVQVQEADVKAWDGSIFHIKNIIASSNPAAKTRVLVTSHWDSRPMADKDGDVAKHKTPVPAANDGASGVGIALELARLVQQKAPAVGVDFILWDAEDYGNYEIEDSWCLGSQYWSKHKHDPNYFPRYGVNLDMVGAKDAVFFYEGHTLRQARGYAQQVWNTAALLGYGNYFQPMMEENGILDDHYFVMKNTGIPIVEIIDRNPQTGSFFPHWHTTTDDMSAIDKNTLKAVGQTLTEVIYKEK